MPLSQTVSRQLMHRRIIDCQGYQRADGLWDIEAHLVDIKTMPFPTETRGELTPGEPLHEMWLRLTLDDNFLIHEVEAVSDATPFVICPVIAEQFHQLKGLRISAGWNQQVKSLLGGVKGCTHLVELLNPLATTAFQTIYPATRQEQERKVATYPKTPPMLNSCHALASDSVVVKRLWPDYYTETLEES